MTPLPRFSAYLSPPCSSARDECEALGDCGEPLGESQFQIRPKGDIASFAVTIDLSKQGLGVKTIADEFDEALSVLATQRESILDVCREDERPMFQFWVHSGLQALEWKHIDFEKETARIEQNQVAGVVKAAKTTT